MKYSLFTHGTALQIESPGDIPDFSHTGFGTRVRFYLPTSSVVETKGGEKIPVQDIQGRGSWFHFPLTAELTGYGYTSPRLESVTLLFQTDSSRITQVVVYDGAVPVQLFDLSVPWINGLRGNFIQSRVGMGSNTFNLDIPLNVLYGIGISFYACCYWDDVADWNNEKRQASGSYLWVAAAGATYQVTAPFVIGSQYVRNVITRLVGSRKNPRPH